MKTLTLANKITLMRILAVPFFIGAVLSYTPARDHFLAAALGIFLIAVVSDVIDGYIARNFGQKTKAGAILDPIADKLLLVSAFLCLYKVGGMLPSVRFPLWFVIGVISRDVVLLAGALIIYRVKNDIFIEPSAWGKATTFFQVGSIITVLGQWPQASIFWVPTLCLTAVSGIGYVFEGIQMVRRKG